MSRFSSSWAKKTVQKQARGSPFDFDESSTDFSSTFGEASTVRLQRYPLHDSGDEDYNDQLGPPTLGLDDDEMDSTQMDFDDEEVHPSVARTRSTAPEPSILSAQNITDMLIRALEANSFASNEAHVSLKVIYIRDLMI